jgi:hypothetical protein
MFSEGIADLITSSCFERNELPGAYKFSLVIVSCAFDGADPAIVPKDTIAANALMLKSFIGPSRMPAKRPACAWQDSKTLP